MQNGLDVQQKRPVPRLEQLRAGERDAAPLLRHVEAPRDVHRPGQHFGIVRAQVLLRGDRVAGPLERVELDALVHRELYVPAVADAAGVLPEQCHLDVGSRLKSILASHKKGKRLRDFNA